MSFLRDFFCNGVFVSKLDQDLINEAWNLIHSSEWVDSEDSIYNLKFCKDSEDPKFKNFAIKLSKLSMFDGLKIIKPNISHMKSYIWKGAEQIPWHSDANRGADITIFCYFTSQEKWKPEWGGSISFCNQFESESQTVFPFNGTMVVIDNIDPFNLHHVEKLNEDVDRYVFTFTYSWTL